MNTLVFIKLVLLIDYDNNDWMTVFRLAMNSKIFKYPKKLKDNKELLVNKYIPKSSPLLLKLKREFENLPMENIAQDSEECIGTLKGTHSGIKKIDAQCISKHIRKELHYGVPK